MKLTKGRKPLIERLKTGMEEAIRHASGEVALKTTTDEVPDPPSGTRPQDLTKTGTRRRGQARRSDRRGR